MPTYELVLVCRAMPRAELVTTLKRTAGEIFKTGGFIRSINNNGKQPTPFKMAGEQGPHREGHYFMIEFEGAPSDMSEMVQKLQRDVDIIRPTIYKKLVHKSLPCLLDDELKPPAYRKEVQEMVEIAKKKARFSVKRGAWKPNTGLDYHPFQR